MVETEIAVKGLELAIDFVRGALEGAELEHLAALLTAKGAGRATGELFLQIFKKYRKADGTLKEVPLEDMRQIARSEPQVIGALSACRKRARRLLTMSERPPWRYM